MARHDNSPELKAVDEVPEEEVFVRLSVEGGEEAVDEELVGVGAAEDVGIVLEVASKEEMKLRSVDPSLDSLIEMMDGDVGVSDPWGEVGERRGLAWGWIVAVGLIFCSGILWSVYQLGVGKVKRVELVEDTLGVLERERLEDEEAAAGIGAIERAVRGFLMAGSVDEMAGYVRHPGRVGGLMEDFYRRKPLETVRTMEVVGFDPLTIERNANFWLVRVETVPAKAEALLVEVNEAGEAKVDWETYVCYQPMDWDEFARERPEGFRGDFRVYIERDFFYSHEFADERRWRSYRLTALGEGEVLFGYVDRRDAGLMAALEEVIDGNSGVCSVMLELHLPRGTRSRSGVVIKGLKNSRWLYLDDDER